MSVFTFILLEQMSFRVIEEHPTLACAAKNLVAAVQSDMFASPSVSTSTPSAFMGASDDEEMESLVSSVKISCVWYFISEFQV